MRICAIGDPHGNLEKIKKIPMKGIDLVLINGDLGNVDFIRQRFIENIKRKKEGLQELEYTSQDMKKVYMETYDSTLNILKYLSKYAPTYSILGNTSMNMIYDSNVKKEEEKYKIKLPSLRQGMNQIKDFYFVRNCLRNINGLRIGFLEYFIDNCWIKEFNVKDEKKMAKAKKETAKAKKVLKNFKNLDILVCHQPPYGYLDQVNNSSNLMDREGKHAGSKVILDYIKKYKPKYVFCGHIHEAKGKTKIGKTEIYNLGEAGHKIIEI